MGNTAYDKLVSLGRTWLPIIAAVLAIISATFTQLSSVPGLEVWAPWLVAIAGVLSAVSAGLNQILKISKDIYKSECKAQEAEQPTVTQ